MTANVPKSWWPAALGEPPPLPLKAKEPAWVSHGGFTAAHLLRPDDGGLPRIRCGRQVRRALEPSDKPRCRSCQATLL